MLAIEFYSIELESCCIDILVILFTNKSSVGIT